MRILLLILFLIFIALPLAPKNPDREEKHDENFYY